MPKFFTPPIKQAESRVKSLESSESHTTEDLEPKISEAGEVRTLLSWVAPSRPFRKKDKSYYTYSLIVVILFALVIFFWLQDFLLIATILALTFVAYVLAFVPPHDITYKISTQGVTISDHFYFWHELDYFWFKEREGHQVLFIQTRLSFPGQLMLVLDPPAGGQNEEEVKRIVARFLPFHEIPRMSTLDKWAEGLQKHFPLENTHR